MKTCHSDLLLQEAKLNDGQKCCAANPPLCPRPGRGYPESARGKDLARQSPNAACCCETPPTGDFSLGTP